ncbi:MAG: flagellar basal body rod protein FlgB [Deltaproteobacteria bacterium]|nr:flagellar basal body rod protein FlgB [Deltaproteobacteria bacterium]
MTRVFTDLFNFADRVQMSTLTHRLKRSQLINANIANAETPGYRALGYEFEERLQSVAEAQQTDSLKTASSLHYRKPNVLASGNIEPDIFIRPTESVTHDGNTVDMDMEMAQLAQNQILYKTAVETINRKIGILRYAINGGR